MTRPPGLRGWPWPRWLLTLLLLLPLSGWMPAQAQTPGKAFNHARTGFVLDGVHVHERCESCHINGVFKGTPRDCASCHTGGRTQSRGNVVKPGNHLPTQATCESCHGTQSFVGARFSHSGVARGTCAICHNGGMAPGKGTGHLATAASCDSCHRTVAWTPASGFDHVGVTAGTCANCHNGARATGRSAGHVPNTAVSGIGNASCDSCHRAGFKGWLPARLHASFSVVAQCAACHSGGFAPAVGKPANALHANATACENCHKSTASWTAGTRVDHGTFSAVTNCASCHNGSAATGKSARHIGTGTATCVGCHNTTGWTPTKWNHTQLVVTNQCASCHNGAQAGGKSANHLLTTASCDTCHKSTASWTTGTRVDHGTFSAATNCASCHNGSAATGKSARHIPVGSANCIACHTTTGWIPSRFNHTQLVVANQCTTCHNGAYPPADGKTPNHVATTAQCDSCHRTTTSWAGATFAHSAANAVGTGSCDGCHNQVAAKGKPATHVPVPAGGGKCDACHRSQSSFAAAVTMNHSAVTAATCKACHNGAFVSQGALAKPNNHIPEATQLLNGAALDCNACHTGTTVWTTVRMNHSNSLGNGAGWCKGCHASGTAFLGDMEKKSLTHERSSPLPTDCSQSGCHRPLGNKGAAYSKWD